MLRLFLALVMVAFGGHTVTAQQAHWKALPLRFDQSVEALYYDQVTDALLIAGMFQQVNGVASNLLQWNGISPYYLPQSSMYITGDIIRYKDKVYTIGNGGLQAFDGNVRTVIDSGNQDGFSSLQIIDDRLVVGGPFKHIAGHRISAAAAWDGNAWTDFYKIDTLLGSGYWPISCFESYKGQVYAAGNFDLTGKPAIKEIARFDGNRWTDVGGGMRGNGLAGVSKMLVWKNELYVAGEFFEKNGAPGNCIAKWDGQRWHRLGTGLLRVDMKQPSMT